MVNSQLNVLPAQARKRIETLESQVSEITGALGLLVSEMQRQGLAFSVKKTSPIFLKPVVQHKKIKNEPSGLAAALARGEAAKVEWVASGEVVSAKILADKWGLTPQALGPAAKRGEVFAILVKRQRYYPKEFLDLDRSAVSTVSKALGSLSPEEKLVFWKRSHGALGGKTVLQTLMAAKNTKPLARVAQLAQAWADEAQAGSHGIAAA
jgi:hypothetical protein